MSRAMTVPMDVEALQKEIATQGDFVRKLKADPKTPEVSDCPPIQGMELRGID